MVQDSGRCLLHRFPHTLLHLTPVSPKSGGNRTETRARHDLTPGQTVNLTGTVFRLMKVTEQWQSWKHTDKW